MKEFRGPLDALSAEEVEAEIAEMSGFTVQDEAKAELDSARAAVVFRNTAILQKKNHQRFVDWDLADCRGALTALNDWAAAFTLYSAASQDYEAAVGLVAKIVSARFQAAQRLSQWSQVWREAELANLRVQ